MTADTPSPELLALEKKLASARAQHRTATEITFDVELSAREHLLVLRALRLAGKPADDGVREAIEPFANALDGVPASMSDARPFARVPNDARTPGTFNTLTFGDLRKLVRALSTKAKP
jgi:hypothetical protein